jgi:hypothetical protein
MKYYNRCGEQVKYYAIKREVWRRFLDHLKTIQKPVHELTQEERNLWDDYYLAKEYGRNEKGLFSLPWKRWQRVNKI